MTRSASAAATRDLPERLETAHHSSRTRSAGGLREPATLANNQRSARFSSKPNAACGARATSPSRRIAEHGAEEPSIECPPGSGL